MLGAATLENVRWIICMSIIGAISPSSDERPHNARPVGLSMGADGRAQPGTDPAGPYRCSAFFMHDQYVDSPPATPQVHGGPCDVSCWCCAVRRTLSGRVVMNSSVAPAAIGCADMIPMAERADDAALRRLYGTHGSALMSYLVRYLRGDRRHAEDIVQETMLRAWRHPEVQSEQGEWSRAWLMTVARRLAIDHLRSQSGSSVRSGR